MRVLHVHSGNIFGGIETFLLTQARYQHLVPDLEFEFALCFGGRFRDELIETGVPIHDLGAVRLRDPLSVRRARRNLEQLLKDNDFDAIVTHSCWTQTGFGPTLRRATAPLVFYMHAPPDGRHWLERAAKRTQPDLVLCNSKFTAASMSLLYPNVKGEILYYPIAAPPVNSAGLGEGVRTKLQTDNDAAVIIQVGRIERGKGHALHLDALALLKLRPNWICWQVGGAQRKSELRYFNELKDKARDLGISDRVRFVDERSDVAQLLSAANIYCQPNSSPESFGITFVEALYAGLPVVTCDIGGPGEIVDDTCGVRLPPGNAKSLANTLQALIDDVDRRKNLARSGPSRANSLCNPLIQLLLFQRTIASVAGQRRAIA